MSCTVTAIPFLLLGVINIISERELKELSKAIEIDTNEIQENEETIRIKEEHFIEKDFETQFMDKNVLIKTLEEHGYCEMTDNADFIQAKYDNYKLSFSKTSEEKPYSLRISCLEADCAEEKVQDISNEYAMNVQEESYLSIVNNLQKQNLKIENEEVMEDNTIVLTVNIE